MTSPAALSRKSGVDDDDLDSSRRELMSPLPHGSATEPDPYSELSSSSFSWKLDINEFRLPERRSSRQSFFGSRRLGTSPLTIFYFIIFLFINITNTPPSSPFFFFKKKIKSEFCYRNHEINICMSFWWSILALDFWNCAVYRNFGETLIFISYLSI